jgi:hypothetical protein
LQQPTIDHVDRNICPSCLEVCKEEVQLFKNENVWSLAVFSFKMDG